MQSAGTITLASYRIALSMRDGCERLGIHVNGTGFVSCPVHSEKTPSCKVYLDHLHCFSCGFHADLIGLVRHVTGFDFWESLTWIADAAGLPRPKRDPEAQAQYEAMCSVSDTYAAIFNDALKDPEPALHYLESRGISRKTTEGMVGYLARCYRPPDEDAARKAGLYSSKGTFLFRDRLIVPILDRGRIVSLYGRALDHDRVPTHIYPAVTDPPMPSTLWNLDECRREKEIYLAESIIDALTLIDRGITNAVGLFGTQGLTDERVAALKRTAVEKVILVFDSDANGAGQAGALKAAEKLFRVGIDTSIITLPLADGEEKCDLNSYFREHSAADFRLLKPRGFFDCLLDTLPKDGTPQERYRAVTPILELIATLPELLWKEHTAALCARVPNLDKQKVKAEITRIHGKAEETEAARGRFRPLRLVDKIREEAPVICFDGRFYRYETGVYSPWYSEEVDQATIALIGAETQGNHLDAVRKFLNSVCFVRPERVNQRGLLNLKNGVLDLASGNFQPHSPEILSTVQSETAFDPDAVCPLWLQTIGEILPDSQLRNLLAQIFGYCLTPDISQQKGFILFGDGGNGKSLVTDVLEALVGRENCAALHLGDFRERFRLAELQNRLVNFSTEVEAKGLVSDARIKGVISGDPLTAERKNQQPFVFRPFVKLIISCNNLPQTSDKSAGYFRRWIVLPFTQTFTGTARDPMRARTIIETELSGVLNWAIGGYKALKEAGTFIEPQVCRDTLQDYRRQTDPTIDFVDECLTVLTNDESGAQLQDIFKAYQKWTGENGNQPLGRNRFYQAIGRTVGKEIIKERDGGRFLKGVYLR